MKSVDVNSTLRRAGGFALVGTTAVTAPVLGQAAFAPFVAMAVLGAFVITDRPLFELFARPGDRQNGRLNGLIGFSLAAAGLALISAELGMPTAAFVAATLIVAYGNLGKRIISETSDNPFIGTAGFVVAATVGGIGGQTATASFTDTAVLWPRFVFLATVGALSAALLREILFERDDPLVMMSSGLLLWLFGYLATDVSAIEVIAALVVTVVLGLLSYLLGTASVAGMLSGVILGLLVIVYGGFGWFAILMTFFSVGALSTKYKYDIKTKRGVAEENEGARGTGNVLGNAAIALLCVILFAAGDAVIIDPIWFKYAFAGSMAAALSDTLSSELGVLFDQPRLITTLEAVPPGTDGGVTWQGELFGLVGASLVGTISFVLLPALTPLGAISIAVSGFLGMVTDSVLGATVEGDRIGNEAVNLAATFTGAMLSVSAVGLLG